MSNFHAQRKRGSNDDLKARGYSQTGIVQADGVNVYSDLFAITAANTKTLTFGSDPAFSRFSFAAGAGPYTYNIELVKTNAVEGDTITLRFDKAASTNPTIVVKNGVGGAALATINNSSAQIVYQVYYYDGSDWVCGESVVSNPNAEDVVIPDDLDVVGDLTAGTVAADTTVTATTTVTAGTNVIGTDDVIAGVNGAVGASAGRVLVKDGANPGVNTMVLDGTSGAATIGANGINGELYVEDGGVAAAHGIALYGGTATIQAGITGTDGLVQVKNTSNEVVHALNAATGTQTVGKNGAAGAAAGRVDVLDGNNPGATTISLMGSTGLVNSNGQLSGATAANGTLPGSGVTVVEYGDSQTVHQSYLTIAFTGADDYDFADGADRGLGKVIYTFPAGQILLLGTTMDLSYTATALGGGAATYPTALGTATAEVGNGTLAAAGEADVIASQAVPFNGGAAQAVHGTQTATAQLLDATTTTGTGVDLHLNIAVLDATTTAAATVAVTGTIVLTWVNCGNY